MRYEEDYAVRIKRRKEKDIQEKEDEKTMNWNQQEQITTTERKVKR